MIELTAQDLAHAERCLKTIQNLWPDQKDEGSIEDRAARLMSVPENLLVESTPEGVLSLLGEYPAPLMPKPPVWKS